MENELTQLAEGQAIVYGGNRFARVSAELARDFVAGDRLVVVNETGALLHVPAGEWEIAQHAVEQAYRAFHQLASVEDAAITHFYELFADYLESQDSFDAIKQANQQDLRSAKARGRSTTRLALTPQMRSDMIAGLRKWRDVALMRDRVTETIEHQGWSAEQRIAGLGVVGFVFEGRPNVFADACGVLRSGNSVAFRIGSDALATARAIVTHALNPAIEQAGIPPGAATLVDSSARSAGYALFSDPRLALAVARGSGQAVGTLGAVARQAGTPVSLHGTGGAWMVASAHADPDRLQSVVAASLDRKVCNTLNTCAVVAERAKELVPRVLAGLEEAAQRRGCNPKLHVVGQIEAVPQSWFDRSVLIQRAQGPVQENMAEPISRDRVGHEWEWEDSPEMTLLLVESVEEGVELFNTHSPRFIASIVSADEDEVEKFWLSIDAPFVGDGFTRWVDGQYSLGRPELGLSNWQFGRLFARAGVLAGDSVFTIRTRVRQSDPKVHR